MRQSQFTIFLSGTFLPAYCQRLKRKKTGVLCRIWYFKCLAGVKLNSINLNRNPFGTEEEILHRRLKLNARIDRGAAYLTLVSLKEIRYFLYTIYNCWLQCVSGCANGKICCAGSFEKSFYKQYQQNTNIIRACSNSNF